MATTSRTRFLAWALGGTALSSALPDKAIGQRAIFSALVAALFVAPAAAQDASAPATITIDPSQSGVGAPKRDMAGNGTPIVKIATPSASGVSYNRYTDFNVDARGAILNNSDKIVTTTLAGYIDGNANLKTSGPAQIILNEVTGNNRSYLGGYLEVAGRPAEIVIANPYGISCNGCGFINAPGVTMVAGRASVDGNGAISGYSVGQTGSIDIDGPGLDASDARLALFSC